MTLKLRKAKNGDATFTMSTTTDNESDDLAEIALILTGPGGFKRAGQLLADRGYRPIRQTPKSVELVKVAAADLAALEKG